MKLIKFLFLVIVALILTNVTLTNLAVDQSVTVTALNQDIAELNHDNTLLNAAIAEAGSLTALRERIAEAGYVENPAIVALPATSAVAAR